MAKFSDIYSGSLVESEPETNLINSGMWYPCFGCKMITQWRDISLGCTVPVCSQECRSVALIEDIDNSQPQEVGSKNDNKNEENTKEVIQETSQEIQATC